MPMLDPRQRAKAETAAKEARFMRQHPGVRRRTPLSSLLIALLVFIVFIFAAVTWMNSTTPDDTEDQTSQQP